MLQQSNISVAKAGIGEITKKDVYQANANTEEDKIMNFLLVLYMN
jgi:translation initiation factor IF-2